MNKIYIKTLSQSEGFDWDEGNINKNWVKHKVTPAKCEQMFYNRSLVIQDDQKHSEVEKALIKNLTQPNVSAGAVIRAAD